MIRSPRGTRVVPRGLPLPTGHSYRVIEEPSRPAEPNGWECRPQCVREPNEPTRYGAGDFVHDQTQEGTPFRILTLIDEHTKQCLATHVGWSVRAVDVIPVIEASIQRYGAPEQIRSDNV